jgi:hypothetical protein
MFFFTHIPAASLSRSNHRHPHPWTDVIINGDQHDRDLIRGQYRMLRDAGFTPTGARGVLWDRAKDRGARLADHDVWRERAM